MDKEEAQWLLTQIDRIVTDRIAGATNSLLSDLRSFHAETLSHFEAVFRRFDQLESAHQPLAAAVNRLVESFDA